MKKYRVFMIRDSLVNERWLGGPQGKWQEKLAACLPTPSHSTVSLLHDAIIFGNEPIDHGSCSTQKTEWDSFIGYLFRLCSLSGKVWIRIKYL